MFLRLSDLRSELGVRLKQPGIGNTQRDTWLNLAVDEIAQQFDLDSRIKTGTFSTVTSTRRYYLDVRHNSVMSLIDQTNDEILNYVSEDELEVRDPDRSETGQPRFFTQTDLEHVEGQPSAASVVRIVSSSASDTSQTVRINGVVAGEEDTELLTLNGTTNVDGTKSFTVIHSLVKDSTTAGRVTATTNSGAVTIGVIPANYFSIQRQPIDLYPIPSGVSVIRWRGVRPTRQMFNSSDFPDLPDMYHELAVILATIKGHEALYNTEQAAYFRDRVYAPMLAKFEREQGNKRRKRSPVIEGKSPLMRPFSPGILPDRDVG